MIYMKKRYMSFATWVMFSVSIACFANVCDSLVAYYPFNGNADDASENKLHGGVFGAFLTEGCHPRQNTAYLFDGDDDYIDAGYSNLFKLDGDVSVSMWVKRSGYGVLFSVEGGGGYGGEQRNENSVICLTASPTGNGRLKYIHEYSNGNNQEHVFDVIPENKWVHIAVVRDNTEKQVTAFMDGNLVGTFHYMREPDNPQTALNLTIGSRSLGDQAFVGAIDEVMLFDRALDESEVDLLTRRSN